MAKITINHEGNEMEFEGTPEEIKEMLTSMGVKPAKLEEKFEEGEEATEGFQVGDYVRVTRNVHEHREGDVLEIVGVEPSSGIFDYGVRNTRFMPRKPNKFRGRTGLISKENIEPIEFIEGAPEVGDKILVVNQRGTLGEYKNGDVLTVVKVENHYDEECYVYVEEDSVSIGLFRNEFEIIERVAGEDEDTLQVGDKVRLLSGGEKFPLFGFHDDKIYEVSDLDPKHSDEGRIQIRCLVEESYYTGYAFPSQLKKVSEEEATLEGLIGKYVKFMEDEPGITAGETYEIIGIDSDGDIVFKDDDDDRRFSAYPCEELHEVVDEPIEVLPPGTKVRSKEFGHIYTLGGRRPERDNAGYGTAYGLVGETSWIGADQFDVVETETTEGACVGDTIKITKDSTGTEKHRVGWAELGQGLMNVGSVGKVTEVTLKGIYAKFDGDQLGAGLVDKSRFYLAHGEYEVISAAEDTPPYEVGDLAVIAEDADEGKLGIGDVVEIIGTAEYYDFNTKRLTDGETEQFDEEELTKYVPEEKEISVGDKVVLAIPKGEKPKYGFGDVKTGDIGEVFSVFGGGTDLSIKFDNQGDWRGITSEVLLVERAETKAEEAEEGGEEPTTFVKGDIVKIIGRTRFGDVSTGATARVVSGVLDYDGELEVEYLDVSDYDYAKPEALAKISVEAAKPADFAEDGDIIRITEDRNGAEVGEIVEVSSVREDGQVMYHYPRKGIRFVGRRGSYEIVAKHSDRKDV